MRVRPIVLVLLGALMVSSWSGRLDPQSRVGIDFYHYWGIAKARSRSSAVLGSPYSGRDGYATQLNALADASTDVGFRKANLLRRTLDATGTPLMYALCHPLPYSYSAALALFGWLGLVAFLCAVIVAGRMRGGDRFETLVVALLLAVAFEPLRSDIAVGNVNAFQLLAAVLLCGWAARGTRRVWLVCGLVVMVLAKPNLGLLGVALFASVWTRHGTAATLRAAGAGLLTGAAMIALSSWYFGDPAVWPDWLDHITGAGQAKFVHDSRHGNFSWAVLLSEWQNLGTRSVTLATAGGLVVSMLAAAGRRWRAALSAPWLVGSAAVVLTLAVLPMVWVHYYVLALLPALWLVLGGTTRSRMLGGLAIVLCAGWLTPLLGLSGGGRLIPWAYALSWVPLWAGVLTSLRSVPSAPSHPGAA